MYLSIAQVYADIIDTTFKDTYIYIYVDISLSLSLSFHFNNPNLLFLVISRIGPLDPWLELLGIDTGKQAYRSPSEDTATNIYLLVPPASTKPFHSVLFCMGIPEVTTCLSASLA